MITFDLGEELAMFQSTALDLAQKRFRPCAREAETSLRAPQDLARAYVDLGFSSMDLPEDVGGLGQGLVTKTVVEEALAYGDLGLALAMPTPGPFGAALLAFGDDAARAKHLAPMVASGARGAIAWSEDKPKPRSFSTVALEQPDGTFRMNGKKSHVVLGHEAAATVVFASVKRIDGASHLGAFVVAAGADGVRYTAPTKGLGLNAAPTTTMTLEDVAVDASCFLDVGTRFEDAAMTMWNRISIVGAARGVGIARAAFEYAKDYAAEREAFGKPIAHFQGLAFLIADMATRVDVMRAVVARAAWAVDENKGDQIERVAMAVAECHQGAMFVTDAAVQVLGGAGFVEDHPVEKWMRDAKAHMSYGISHQLADLIIGRRSLGGTGVDLEEDLPMPELQSVMA